MSAIQPIQFYRGVIKINNVNIPFLPGVSLPLPDNYDIPPVIGNDYQLCYGDGVIMPMFSGNVHLRDTAGEALSSTFLSPFLSRTSDAFHDTTALTNGIQLWDGLSGYDIAGVKPDGFTLSGSFGAPLAMSVRYVGTTATENVGAPPTNSTGFTPCSILRFNKVTFGGNLASAVESFQLSLSNNHVPNGGLSGGRGPVAMNAAQQTVALTLTMNAQSAADVDTFLPDGTAIVITITGSSKTRVFTINNPLVLNRKSRGIAAPHTKRTYEIACLAANSTAPLSISGTGF